MVHKFHYYALAFGLLLAAAACSKARLNNTIVADPNKALSSYQALNFQKTYNSIEEAFNSLDALPQRERIRFTDTKAEFVHELIWGFEMVIDKTKGTYQVENLRPLYVLLSEDGTKESLPSLPEPAATTFRNGGVMLSEEEPLYTRAFRSLNINPSAEDYVQPIMYHSAIIGAAIAEKEPEDYKNNGGVYYEVVCAGGALDGTVFTTPNEKEAVDFGWKCVDAGGCSRTCRMPAYIVPVKVIDRYKITDKNLSRFIKAIETSNISYAKTQNTYNKIQETSEQNTFEAVRKYLLDLDASYSHSNSAQAIQVE